MSRTKVVSFDAEGTLVTPRFSEVIWHEAIPALFAEQREMDLDQARKAVYAAYDEVGDHRVEWYDIKYWFRRFGFDHDYRRLLLDHREEISYYEEVPEVLERLGESYDLIIVSNSAQEFLDPLTQQIGAHFERIFCTLSEFSALKSPALFSHICLSLGVEPREMVHVGDSWEFDCEMPRKAGVRAVHLERDGGGEGDGVVTDLRQLVDLL
jgi:putative hydrolase of the HAD superfamily